jgi:hypothetical protein
VFVCSYEVGEGSEDCKLHCNPPITRLYPTAELPTPSATAHRQLPTAN